MIVELEKGPLDSIESFQESVRSHVRRTIVKRWENLTRRELYLSVALSVRDRLVDRMLDTEERVIASDAKRLYYLSMEFLIGRSLGNNLQNLGLLDLSRKSLIEMGVDIEEIREEEADAALGNGGLGRLAACFLDSLATLGMPGYGYGINYEYGLFKQEIENGYQKERPDHWLENGSPWEIKRPDEAVVIPVYGRIANPYEGMDSGWVDWKILVGVPHDMPIVGYGGRTVNFLRLYSARSSSEFDMNIFNQGDYIRAVEQKISTETISKVLYPSDSIEAGKELRLLQEYFLVGCAIRDIVTRYLKNHSSFDSFSSKVAIQLNDTHPALTIAELMRVLVDQNNVPWEKAWEITQATLGYTNHTLLPEALERWPLSLIEKVLPRHLGIIYEINRRFLETVEAKWPGDRDRARRVAIIDEDARQVRMAHLAIVGSHSVNGVAALHSELVKTTLVPDFYELWPERFNNKTNGVTQRRWLLKANPGLATLINDTIGDGWITDLNQLRGLEPSAEDAAFQDEFIRTKRENKESLAKVIMDKTGVSADPLSLFDVHIKRIHEYKRQLLNVMRIIHEYLSLVEDDQPFFAPRTYIFAGKAAPGYWAAKQIIKLINNVGHVINRDRRTFGLLKVVFIPDYRVSLAERIIPAADLSEHISTAGKEASGTGNMKFAMNGALTIGTLDGANIEIREEVGDENIFIFGLNAEEIQEMHNNGSYDPRSLYESDPNLKRVMDTFLTNLFSLDEPGLFDWIFRTIVEQGDEYFHLADLPSYIEVQQKAAREYRNKSLWARKAILNVARIGRFSSDRTVLEYARDIWDIHPL
ncbi:MAG TPA: glycogen/starch/alpha-glucan phosphorylase [Blastocatellia bacterium]|nr:glycogen/starch/alpha-glucan phosphorylase [Blastocatellia bacterium]